MLRYEHDRHVHEVLLRHEGTRYLGIEGEKNDIGYTDEEEKSENIPDDVGDKSHIDEFCLQTFDQRSAFKFDFDLVLGLFCHSRCRRLCIHFCFFLLSSVSSLIEDERRKDRRYQSYRHDDYHEVHPCHRRTDFLSGRLGILVGDELHDRVGISRERVDDRVDSVNQDHRADHREGDLPECLPSGRSVYLARFVDRRGDRLKSREEYQHLNARTVHYVENVVDGPYDVFDYLGTYPHVREQDLDVDRRYNIGRHRLSRTVCDAVRVV